MANPCFAYSLSQAEQGWAWRVYDEAGEIVDAGLRATQHAAEAAVRLAMTEAGRAALRAGQPRS